MGFDRRKLQTCARMRLSIRRGCDLISTAKVISMATTADDGDEIGIGGVIASSIPEIDIC